MSFTFEGEPHLVSVGDIVKHEGKNYKITKKTNYNVAIARHYWFDALYDWAQRKLAKNG